MRAEDVLVSAGSEVNMMRAIGTGKIPAGVATVSLGTASMICAFLEQPVVDSKGEIAGFRDGPDHWLPSELHDERCGHHRTDAGASSAGTSQ